MALDYSLSFSTIIHIIPVLSTLITSAPRSASIIEQNGPATTLERN